jgi:endonuclease YncB( thermonuclease family)
MQRFIVFWKKDLLNKLIVVISLSLVGGGLVFFYLVGTMPAGKSLAGAVSEYIPFFGSPTPYIQAIYTDAAATIQARVTATIRPLTIATSAPTASPPTSVPATEHPTPTLELTAVPTTGKTATSSSSISSACIPDKAHQTGTALDVLDGNTVKVLVDGSVYVVRYIGVSVQDPSTPYGRAAAIKNGELVFGKQITLVSDSIDKDSSGHLLRYILVGDTFINRELIAQGLASALDVPPGLACTQTFRETEQAAVTANLGQWSTIATLPSP